MAKRDQLLISFENEELFLNTIKYLSDVIDAKDEYTIGHSERVQKFSMRLGKELGLSKKQMDILYLSSILHDIGKVKVPLKLLKSKRKLNKYEYIEIQRHSAYGAFLLGSFKYVDGLQDAIKYHHERYDGKGYPDGLKGKEIPIYSRIISVCDAYDAMTSYRHYLQRINSEEYAIKELLKNRGSQFDPEIVDAFMSVYNNGYIHLEQALYYIKQHNINTIIPVMQLLERAKKSLKNKKDKAFCDYNKGKILIRKGEYKKGINLLLKYLNYAENDMEKSSIYNNLSSAYLKISDYKKVLYYSDLVLKTKVIFQKARVYRHMAIYYFHINDLNTAINELKKSENIYERLESKIIKEKTELIKNNFSIIKYNQIIKFSKKIKEDIAKYYDIRAFFYYNIAEFDNALYYYKKAIELKHFYSDVYGSIRSQAGIALVYMQLSDFKNAEYNLLEVKKYAEKLNDMDGLIMVYTNMGKLYSLWNKKDKAIKYYKKVVKIGIEHYNNNNVRESVLYLLHHYKSKTAIKRLFEKIKKYSYYCDITEEKYFNINNANMKRMLKKELEIFRKSEKKIKYMDIAYRYLAWLKAINDKNYNKEKLLIEEELETIKTCISKERILKYHDIKS